MFTGYRELRLREGELISCEPILTKNCKRISFITKKLGFLFLRFPLSFIKFVHLMFVGYNLGKAGKKMTETNFIGNIKG